MRRPISHVVFTCVFALTASASYDSPITPAQQQYLANVKEAAAPASDKAEKQLLAMFSTLKFRLGLLLNTGWRLFLTPSDEIMSQLKGALASMEYTSNFGVDPDWRKKHPGEPAMGFDTIEEYGYIPNMWELRARKSPLVNGTPADEFEIMDSAETGLYRLPLTSKPLPIGPDATQALERPQYIAGNLRKTDIGIARYGPFAAVLRNEVIRDRAAILSSDSGGWENICNNSAATIQKWFVIGRVMARCSGINMEGDGRPVPATVDNQLHAILGNTNVFGKVGGSLSRLMYQMLTPNSATRPFETLFYTEAGLLGPLRPTDMKLMVASFPGIFGSDQANSVRLFCLKHRIPLAWALNRGQTWSASVQDVAQWLPFAPTFSPVGPDRLLDPITWEITNATMQLPSVWKVTWEAIFKEMEAKRASNGEPQAHEYKSWWDRLSVLGGTVQPLRAGECGSADLCFGTYRTKSGKKDCLCRDANSTYQVTSTATSLPSALPSGTQAHGVSTVVV